MSNYYNRFLISVQRWPESVAVEMKRHSATAESSTTAGTITERYTFRELELMSCSVGRWLRDHGMEGQRCVILAANSPQWVTAYLGTLAAGAITVPLDTALNPQQVRKLILDSQSSLVFVDNRHRAALEEAVSGLSIKTVLLEKAEDANRHTDLDSILATGPGDFVPAEMQADDVAAILYSSGTTGDPKGVMLTHDNLSAETGAICEVVDLGPADSMLSVLPLFHALAQVTNLLLPVAAGTRVVFLETLNTTELLHTLPSVNIFVCVPQFFYLIHERIWKEVEARGKAAKTVFRLLLRISSWGRKLHLNLGKIFFKRIHHLLGTNMRYLVTGGSRFDVVVGREFEALGFTMLQGYGLTETNGAATYTPPGKVDIASVGQPLPGVEVKILNPQHREETSGPATGEILIRGRIVMKGYWNRPDATEAALKDGWLHTGDLGYINERGNIFITGREKEVIVLSSGKNIYPEEIEAHYLKTAFIKEICVLGLESRPGAPVSERLHGVVVPNFELLREKRIVNTREVLRYEIENLSMKLPSTKRILSYEIWQTDLPRTTTRKLKRFEIEKRVRENESAGVTRSSQGEQPVVRKFTEEDKRWLEQPEVIHALKVIRGSVKDPGKEMHPSDNLELDLGLDSMERVELLVALERELGSHVEDSVSSEVYTVRELVDAVQQAHRATRKLSSDQAWDAVLRIEPTDPHVTAVTQTHRFWTAFWFFLARIGNLLARALFHLKVEGLEKLPKTGPFVISPNHQSFLDGPILMGALPWNVFKETFFVGTSEIFGDGVWRRLARTLKIIPVDPDANLVPAMQAGAYGLRYGKILVLYPEGERSIDGDPKVFKKGAAILATHLHVPIIPVAIDGSFEAWPRSKSFQKFTKIRLCFGEAIYPPPASSESAQTYESVTSELRSRVVGMWERMHVELQTVPLRKDQNG